MVVLRGRYSGNGTLVRQLDILHPNAGIKEGVQFLHKTTKINTCIAVVIDCELLSVVLELDVENDNFQAVSFRLFFT